MLAPRESPLAVTRQQKPCFLAWYLARTYSGKGRLFLRDYEQRRTNRCQSRRWRIILDENGPSSYFSLNQQSTHRYAVALDPRFIYTSPALNPHVTFTSPIFHPPLDSFTSIPADRAGRGQGSRAASSHESPRGYPIQSRRSQIRAPASPPMPGR